MTITTVLAGAVMRGVWRWQWPTVAVVVAPIMTVDLAQFGANALKIPTGGWFPLVIGLVVFTIMTTWRAGCRLVETRLASETMPLATFLATCEEAAEARVSGIAVFLTAQTELVPVTLLRNLKHNKVLHWTVLLVRVITENIPEWQAQTGLRHVRSAAVFGRSRRILALPRRRTYHGSWSGRTSPGRRRSSAVAVSGDRLMKTANARTFRT